MSIAGSARRGLTMPGAVLALLLLAPLSALAGWIDKSGAGLADGDDHKAVGDFGALMIIVADERAMFEHWDASEQAVNIATVDRVAAGEPVNAFIAFSGCRPDPTGHCDVTVRFRVYLPNGKAYVHTAPMEVWQFKKAPAGRRLELGAQYLKLVIEPSDMPGKYTVVADVRDHVTGVSVNLKAPFVAITPR